MKGKQGLKEGATRAIQSVTNDRRGLNYVKKRSKREVQKILDSARHTHFKML